MSHVSLFRVAAEQPEQGEQCHKSLVTDLNYHIKNTLFWQPTESSKQAAKNLIIIQAKIFISVCLPACLIFWISHLYYNSIHCK